MDSSDESQPTPRKVRKKSSLLLESDDEDGMDSNFEKETTNLQESCSQKSENSEAEVLEGSVPVVPIIETDQNPKSKDIKRTFIGRKKYNHGREK